MFIDKCTHQIYFLLSYMYLTFITMASYWPRWRLNSRLFTQSFIQV